MANTSLSTNKLQFTNTSINEINSKLDILPVGFIYIQLPKKKKPSDFLAGTWEDITDEYAGLFFRAEGGNADPFIEEGDIIAQEDKIRNINGKFNVTSTFDSNDSMYSTHGGQGSFKVIQEYDWYTSTYDGVCKCGYIGFDANISQPDTINPMAGHADGPEIRPVNVSIRIWERTA